MSRAGASGCLYRSARWAYRPLKTACQALRLAAARRAARAVVREYLAGANDFAGLQVGCGPHRLDGWLNSDVLGNLRRDLYVDIEEPLPFPDGSLDAVYASEVIEHVPAATGRFFLAEASRVLRPRGVLRVTTPDLAAICRLYLGQHADATIEQFGAVWRGGVFTPEAWVNGQFRDHGHQFLWSWPALRDAMTAAGFAHVVQPEPRRTRSPIARLSGLERHYGPNLPRWLFARTLIVEASKQPVFAATPAATEPLLTLPAAAAALAASA